MAFGVQPLAEGSNQLTVGPSSYARFKIRGHVRSVYVSKTSRWTDTRKVELQASSLGLIGAGAACRTMTTPAVQAVLVQELSPGYGFWVHRRGHLLDLSLHWAIPSKLHVDRKTDEQYDQNTDQKSKPFNDSTQPSTHVTAPFNLKRWQITPMRSVYAGKDNGLTRLEPYQDRGG